MPRDIYPWFDNAKHIVIKSENVKDIFDNQDILCIILNNFQHLDPRYIFVSNKRDNLAIVVADNINYIGTVKISFEQIPPKKENKEIKEKVIIKKNDWYKPIIEILEYYGE